MARIELSGDLARHLRPAAELRRTTDDEALASGLPALDRLLGGGLPRGVLLEAVGRRSSGRFALVLGALASVTSAGENAALIDLGGHFDPGLGRASGIELPRLLWVGPKTLRAALVATDLALATGFPLVVLDLGLPPLRGAFGRTDGPWLRLARSARTRDAALLVSTPYRMSGPAAGAVIELDAARALWSRELLLGLDGRATLAKRPGHAPGQRVAATWMHIDAIRSGEPKVRESTRTAWPATENELRATG